MAVKPHGLGRWLRNLTDIRHLAKILFAMTSRARHAYLMSEIDRIKGRRRQIAQEISEIMAKVETLREEERELGIAEKVLSRLSKVDISSIALDDTLPVENSDKAEEFTLDTVDRTEELVERVETGGKPPNTPAIPVMIIEALGFADLMGENGLTPRGMTDYISRKWWPDVSVSSIGPIAWRMWKRGQLAKDDSVYSLPRSGS